MSSAGFTAFRHTLWNTFVVFVFLASSCLSAHADSTHDDFNDSSANNDWGGSSGYFTGGSGTLAVNRVSSDAQEGARSLELQFSVVATNDYSGYYSTLNDTNIFVDTPTYRSLSFWVKGVTGNEAFKIEIGESSALTQKTTLRDFINGGVTTAWREVNVPMMAYDQLNFVDPHWNGNFAIVFEEGIGNPKSGVVRIDNVRIVQNPETYVIDSYDDPDTTKSSFGGSNVFFENGSDINAQRDTTTFIGDTGGSLRIYYNQTNTAGGNYLVYEQTLNNGLNKGQDIRPMTSIHFWAKTDSASRGLLPNLWLFDMGSGSVQKDIESFVPALPTDTWVPVNIPLNVFSSTDTSSAKMFKWAWEYEDKSGTMWIDAVELSKGYNLTAPVAPSLTSPSSDSVIQETTPTFSWAASSDAQGIGGYFIQVVAYDDTDYSDPVLSAVTTSPGKSFSQALSNGARYRWRVATYDQHGNWSVFSDSKAFKIQTHLNDDFNDSSSLNKWGGTSGGFTGGGGSASVNRISSDLQEGARALEIAYTVSGASGDYGGYYSELNNANFTDTRQWRSLSFFAKGLTGGEIFKIELGESAATTQQVPIRDFVNGGFPTSWREINIPLSAFDQLNFKNPWWNRNIAFSFEYDQGLPRTGTVRLDNIRFMTEPDTYFVDTFDHSDTSESSFGGTMVYFENNSDLNAQLDTTTYVGDTGGSLRIGYNVSGAGGGNYVVIEQTVNNGLSLGQDIRWMKSLHFWIKSDSVPRGLPANLWMLDMGNNSAAKDLEVYIPALPSDTWVPVNIPLKAFTGADTSSLKMIKWAWEYEDKSGTMWIDAPEFSRGYDVTAPNTPTLSAPAANALVIDSTPDFSWTGSGDAQGETYFIQIAAFSDTDFSDPVISRVTSATAITFSQTLGNGTKYQWRVAAYDGHGNWTGFGDTRSFSIFEDAGRSTVFVSDRGDSTNPLASDSSGAFGGILEAINALTPNNGPDTVVIFQRIASDSYRLSVPIVPDTGMTIIGFKEWNRRRNGNNSDTAGGADTYAKIANASNTSVIYVPNIDDVTIAGLILEGDSAGGTAHHGLFLDNSSNDSISVVQIYRMKTGVKMSQSETNTLSGLIVSSNLDEGIVLDSASQNNRVRGATASGNDSAGVMVAGSASLNNRLQENSILSGGIGIQLMADANALIDNVISSNRLDGIQLDSSAFNRLFGNRILNNAGYGIRIINSSQGNYAAQNEIDSAMFGGVFISSAGTNHTDTFESNNITRCDTGVLNAEGVSFDFRNNWWNSRNEDAVTDSAVSTGGGSILLIPIGLNAIDTSAGADTVSPDSTRISADSSIGATTATIKWDTVSLDRDGTALNGLAGFHIFRSTSALSDWYSVLIDTVLAGSVTDTQYVATGLSGSTTYYFRVTAFDSHYTSGRLFLNESAFSDTRVVVTTASYDTATVHDNYNDNLSTNNWGGGVGTFTGGTGSSSATRATTSPFEGARSMQIDFGVTGSADYAGLYSELNNWNPTDTDQIRAWTFWVKGAAGQEIFAIELGESSAKTQRIPISDYLNGGASTSWREVNIPLMAFDDLNFTNPKWNRNFAISFLNSLGPPYTGSIKIDSVGVRKFADTYYIETFDDGETYENSWGGANTIFGSGGGALNAWRDTTTFAGDTGASFRMYYTVPNPGGGDYVVFEMNVNNGARWWADFSRMTSIRFFIKGDSASSDADMNVWVLDSGTGDALVDMEKIIPDLPYNAWVPVNIPLSRFTDASPPDTHFTKLIKFAWEYDVMSGTTWVDAIEVSSGYNLTCPDSPLNLAPSNASDTTTETPVFRWSSVSDPQGVSYFVQVTSFSDTNFSNVILSGITTSAETTFAQKLTAGSTYQWRVAAFDGHGNWSSFSDSTRFRIVSGSPPIINISSYDSGTFSGTSAVYISGTVSDSEDTPAVVDFLVNGTKVSDTAAVESSGKFGDTIFLSGSGLFTITAACTDTAKNTGSASVSLTVDLGNPIIRIAASVLLDTQSSYTIKGIVYDSKQITELRVTHNSETVILVALASDSKTFSFNVQETLVVGKNQFVIKATDTSGLIGYDTLNVYRTTEMKTASGGARVTLSSGSQSDTWVGMVYLSDTSSTPIDIPVYDSNTGSYGNQWTMNIQPKDSGVILMVRRAPDTMNLKLGTADLKRANLGFTVYEFNLLDSKAEKNIGSSSGSFSGLTLSLKPTSSTLGGVDVTTMKLFTLNESTGVWDAVSGGYDASSGEIKGTLSHLSMYAIFPDTSKLISTHLSGVIIYPNPFVPNDGVDENGRWAVPGDFTTGVIVDNLTDDVDVQIFTVGGRQVLQTRVQNAGRFQWDVTNKTGNTLASGIYLIVIKDMKGRGTAIRKLAVVK